MQFGAKSNIQQIIPFHFLCSNILLKLIKFLSQMPLLIPCHQSNYILPNKIILPTWLPIFPTQYQWNQTINSYIPQVDRSFNLDFGGSIQGKLHVGLVKPPRNRKLPFLQPVQSPATTRGDQYIRIPRCSCKPVRVDVIYVSTSFLVKNSGGRRYLGTAFRDLGQYSCILSTALMSCNDVLLTFLLGNIPSNPISKKVSFKFRLPKTPFQTLYYYPFQGICVYLRSE